MTMTKTREELIQWARTNSNVAALYGYAHGGSDTYRVVVDEYKETDVGGVVIAGFALTKASPPGSLPPRYQRLGQPRREGGCYVGGVEYFEKVAPRTYNMHFECLYKRGDAEPKKPWVVRRIESWLHDCYLHRAMQNIEGLLLTYLDEGHIVDYQIGRCYESLYRVHVRTPDLIRHEIRFPATPKKPWARVKDLVTPHTKSKEQVSKALNAGMKEHRTRLERMVAGEIEDVYRQSKNRETRVLRSAAGRAQAVGVSARKSHWTPERKAAMSKKMKAKHAAKVRARG